MTFRNVRYHAMPSSEAGAGCKMIEIFDDYP
jgi:hypothetical protein